MDDQELYCLAEHPQWSGLLEAYLDMLAQLPPVTDPSPNEGGPRWVSRISQWKGVSSDELSYIHGQLIAEGWLHFQLEDGQLGLQYRVSPEGRRILKRLEQHLRAQSDSIVHADGQVAESSIAA